MKKLFSFLTYIVIHLSVMAKASTLGFHLLEWRPSFHQGTARFLIPIPNGMSATTGLKHYIDALHDYKIFSLINQLNVEKEEVQLLPFSQLDQDAMFVLLNNIKDLTPNDKNIKNFNALISSNDTDMYFIPMIATVLLDEKTAKVFSSWVAYQIPYLVATGGDDIDPAIYNQPNRHSRDVNSMIDRFEMGLLKEYIAAARGFVLGICRGEQFISALMGYPLFQDIQIEVPRTVEVPHARHFHEIQILPTRLSLLKKIYPHTRVLVNSYHHQAVDFANGPENGPLELAAISDDGVVEALEFKNGHGLLVEFHPERDIEDLEKSRTFFQVIDQQLKSQIQRRCSYVFR